MQRHHFLRWLRILAFVWLMPATSQAAALPASEKAKIEALIHHLGNLKNAKFIRNGSEYDAATAVKFLRGKWDSNADEIHNAKDFIEKAATKSSTSGKEYQIKLADGSVTPCGKYLRARLAEAEATEDQ